MSTPYKILVTTVTPNAVHTTVLEYETCNDAELAMTRFDENVSVVAPPESWSTPSATPRYRQTMVRLYR